MGSISQSSFLAIALLLYNMEIVKIGKLSINAGVGRCEAAVA